MMGDLKKRASFARLVNYVNNPKKARLIDSKDVRLDDNAAIARSMQGQADDKPGRKLKNPVYHISLDFAHEDAPRLTDELMAEIAREYMKRMGIVNTQYIICRHTDKEHPHLHIVANRVDNAGNTISDRNDAIRNVAVCKALTREYGLHFSKGKEKVKRDRLRGKDKVKYQIHDAVKAALPRCGSWSELCDRLAKQRQSSPAPLRQLVGIVRQAGQAGHRGKLQARQAQRQYSGRVVHQGRHFIQRLADRPQHGLL